MKKIAILVHQYGEEIVGGAEGYSKDLAEHLANDFDVDVYTTTSVDYNTWAPYYADGKTVENGVTVYRFSVDKEREMGSFSETCNKIGAKILSGGQTTDEEDEQWITEEGPFCPSLISEITNKKNDYDLFIVVTYIYYLAVKAIPELADRVLFISTAHDEPWINMSMFKRIFDVPRYFGFLTEAEEQLVRQKFNNYHVPSKILGTGIEIKGNPDFSMVQEKFSIDAPFLVYVGRLDASKGCEELCRFFTEYKQKNNTDLKLVLVGKGSMKLPENNDIIATGFVTDEEKYSIISGAVAMVTPSPYESLCIALLEAMKLGIPIIANGKCEVLKQHCIKSNAGLYYSDSREFNKIVQLLYSDEQIRDCMGENGVEYVNQNYTWNIVKSKISVILDELMINSKTKLQDVNEHKIILSNDSVIQPVNEDAIVVVTAADDNYSKYACVTINSIIENANCQDVYDILVLTNNMSDESIAKILTLVSNTNINVRFVFVDAVINSLNINISNNYKIITYYRLLLQKIMKKYSKVIYMDSDVVVNNDLKKLWEVNFNGELIAGTYDPLIAAWQNYDSGMQAYFESLDVCNPGFYVQAGVLMLNIEELNKEYDELYLLQKACEEHYIFADQDLLNIACKDRILYFSPAWDVLNLSEEARSICMNYLPSNLITEMKDNADCPYAVHYVEQSFPCLKNDRIYGSIFWKYVYSTPFYDEIRSIYVSQMSTDRTEKVTENKSTLIKRVGNYLKRRGIVKHRAKEQTIDGIKINGEELKNTSVREITLHSGDELTGPNIFLSKGKHLCYVNINVEVDSKIKIKIVAGARHINVGEFELVNGKNNIYFELEKNLLDVELIIVNSNLDDIIIKCITVC